MLVIVGPHVIGAVCGLLMGIAAGIWLQEAEAALYLGLAGAFVGGLIGPFLVAIPMAAIGFLLLLLYPSHRGYLIFSGIVAVIGASIAAQVHGYTAQEWLVAAAAYGCLCVIACEMCGAIYKQCNRSQTPQSGQDRDLDRGPDVGINGTDPSADEVQRR